MQVMVLVMLMMAGSTDGSSPERSVFDFSADERRWPSIDDSVMGGRSASESRIRNGNLVFTGTVSLENNGGFASVRSSPQDHQLSGSRGLSLRFRGDGKTYGIRIKADQRFDGVNYQTPLVTVDGEWKVIRIPFEEFQPVFRGRFVAGYGELDPADIKSFGLMISGKQTGPFRLDLDWIRVY